MSKESVKIKDCPSGREDWHDTNSCKGVLGKMMWKRAGVAAVSKRRVGGDKAKEGVNNGLGRMIVKRELVGKDLR